MIVVICCGGAPLRRQTCLAFRSSELRRANIVGLLFNESDDAVLGGIDGTGGVLGVDVGVGRCPVDVPW